jgi:hypothetical protein
MSTKPRHVIPLKGLTFDEGVSYEQVISILTGNGIEHLVSTPPSADNAPGKYFRGSTIQLYQPSVSIISGNLGNGHSRMPNVYYYGYWRIGDGFSFGTHTGDIALDNGRLVERVCLHYINPTTTDLEGNRLPP